MTLFNWGNKSEPMRAAYQKDYVNEMEIHMVLRKLPPFTLHTVYATPAPRANRAARGCGL
jgi:hypothetical protein